jgi:hypothetical protein
MVAQTCEDARYQFQQKQYNEVLNIQTTGGNKGKRSRTLSYFFL